MNDEKQPLVSIVIPCYNHGKFVQDCIQSVIDQTYENIELIIIDDGSKDNSVERIQQMISTCEKRFNRFEFRSRSNKGLSSTLNEAIEWCKGKYFSAIASDDMIFNSKIKDQVKIMTDNPDLVALFGGVELIDENNNIIKKIKNNTIKYYCLKDIILHKHIIYAPTQLMCLDVVNKIGGYKKDMIIEDWYMWIKMAEIGKLAVYPNIYSRYRQHSDNTVKQLEKMHNSRFDVLNCFENSKYYNEAIFNVRWLNNMEYVSLGRTNKLEVYFKMFFLNPVYFMYKLFGKVFS